MAAPQPLQRKLPPRQVYKSVDSKCSAQFLEARVGRNALLAVIPDPVTCFSTAKYSQMQLFRVHSDSNLVIVDWVTSGRHESGERWEFDLYKSTNHIYLDGDQPLFLDSVLLDKRSGTSIAEQMQEYQVMAMVIISGPKLKDLRCQLQEEVKQMMSRHLRSPNTNTSHHVRSEPRHGPTRPLLIASCSTFGPQALGMVVRIAAVTTESVYMFLRHHLTTLKPFLGASPYCQAGR
uniref:Urease accessory protein D n=1 Tax=Musa acuminata subsp. malaccensis TaxID=214687 RepID=A0A804KQT3_MUSAM